MSEFRSSGRVSSEYVRTLEEYAALTQALIPYLRQRLSEAQAERDHLRTRELYREKSLWERLRLRWGRG